MKLRDFVDLFTAAVYHANERNPGEYFQIGPLMVDYGLTFKDSWFPIIFEDGIFHQRFRSARNIGEFEDQSVQISAEGIRWVEPLKLVGTSSAAVPDPPQPA